MRVKWNTKWREASCVRVVLSVKVVVTTSFPLYGLRPTSGHIYLPFRFIYTTHDSPFSLPSHRTPSTTSRPTTARVVCPAPGPFTFRFLYAGWAAPPHSGQCSKGRRREKQRKLKEGEDRVARRAGPGESEILKRHKGRPHALKGNNSFTTEADSTWSDVWKFVCLLATRPIDFFSNRFFSFFTLLFPRSFFRASLIRITFILSNSRTTYIGVRTDGPAC